MGNYYVYEQAYPDDFLDQELAGTVFYVGKGTGNRIDFHEEAASGKHYDANQQKCAIIREIQAQGKQVVKRKSMRPMSSRTLIYMSGFLFTSSMEQKTLRTW